MESEADAIIVPRTEDLVFWLFWLVLVIFFLLWDLLKAWKRGAPWIPGQTLVLSALIIQLLSFIDYSHISVYSGSGYQSEKVEVILVKDQLVIDSGRLMMCVLIAYLLPGMARSGSIGSNLAALALSITFHVVSEIRSIWKVEKRNKLFDGRFSLLCSTTLIAVILYLLLLLIWATMIGRSIRRIMSQKIRPALSCHITPCNETKDHVLRCWIVARLSQPEYFLVRSGLRSMAWLPVTACIVVHVIKWRYVQFTDHESLYSVIKRTMVQFVIGGQVVIVLIGWIVLAVGWVTSCMHGDISSGDYFKRMGIEDARTVLTAYFIRLCVRDKRIQEKTIREMKKIRDNNSLCYTRHLLQKIFSMQNLLRWLTSTKRRLSRIITRVIDFFSKPENDGGQFSMYKETSKKLIPKETAKSLWEANQWGFRKVNGYMEQGRECSPSELSDLLGFATGTAEGEADREKAVHLQRANKKSWKRTAVSLIHLMIYSYDDSDASVIEKAMQCYIQGWEYMNFVDGLNEEVNSLGQQADEQFDSLQHSWNKRARSGMLEREIKRPLRKLVQQWKSHSDEIQRNLQNSRDLTKVAKYCLLVTWTVMDISAATNKIDLLRCELAKVYFLYMKEGLKEAVLKKCSKLAEEGMEEEILKVAFLAAKAKGVLDKVRERNNTDQASTSSTIPPVNEQTWHTALRRWLRWLQLYTALRRWLRWLRWLRWIRLLNEEVGEGNDLENPVELRQNTDQASTSSTIPTVKEQGVGRESQRDKSQKKEN